MKYKQLKKLYIILVFLMDVFCLGCHKNQVIIQEPKLDEKPLEILATQVSFNWTIDYPGRISSVVEISSNEDMTEAIRYGSDAETTHKTFTVCATGLAEATKYYYRYLVWNPYNDFKMDVRSFVTDADLPKVKTVEVTDITRTSARVVGEVTGESGSSVVERGICWAESHTPTINGDHISNGNGLGMYSVVIANLNVAHTYCVRAYAINEKGVAYGEELSFITGNAVIPTVVTGNIFNIDWRTAVGRGSVTDDGDAEVTERGICWDITHNPEITGNYANNGNGTGSYTANLTGLTAGTTYYVRAYAKNQAGLSYGNEVSFQSKDPELPIVSTNDVSNISLSSAISGGNVTSDGGLEVTEHGISWSIFPNPEIIDNHSNNGTGLGSYVAELTGLTSGTTYYVRAYAINGMGVNYGEEKQFSTMDYPIGAVKGLFTINANGGLVCFSQGNLQYQASSDTWQFAENQHDLLGGINNGISYSYSGWIDLFGWATSGYLINPYTSSTSNSSYNVYGNNGNINGSYLDWGYNTISNGTNSSGQWRILSKEEWVYLFNARITASGIHYAKACVNDVNGVILLPDNWNPTVFPLNEADIIGSDFSSNIISGTQWNTLNQEGAVFLPAAGSRYGTSVFNVGTHGYYWSGTGIVESSANCLKFDSETINPSDLSYRCYGQSVRLVHDVE